MSEHEGIPDFESAGIDCGDYNTAIGNTYYGMQTLGELTTGSYSLPVGERYWEEYEDERGVTRLRRTEVPHESDRE